MCKEMPSYVLPLIGEVCLNVNWRMTDSLVARLKMYIESQLFLLKGRYRVQACFQSA